MRICVFSHVFPRFKEDTEAAFMHGFCEGLQRVGNEVFLLTAYDEKFNRPSSLQSYHIENYKYIWPKKFHVLGYSRSLQNDMKLKSNTYFLAPLLYFFSFIALLRLVKREKIEVISAHWILPNGFVAAWVSLLTGVPLQINLCGSDVFVAGKYPIFKYMALFAAKVAKKVIGGGSIHWAEDLIKLGADPKKCSASLYGVDTQVFKPSDKGVAELKKQLSLNSKQLVVMGLGRLVEKKGFVYLIRTMKSIIKKHKNVVYVLIGDGDQRKELEALAKAQKMTENLRMPGYAPRDKAPIYYNLADIFVATSTRDHSGNLDDQPLSLLEAMSCGKPVVATGLAGIKTMVTDGVNGLVFADKNVAQLTKNIDQLVASSVLRQKFAKTNRKLCLDKFSIEGIGRYYTKVFQEIINKPQ
ncbi:MAG: glycosyltransferase [Patescibacteria group bacterium]|nr:glycosyltransferase [Patescibacteria group bacterium]